MRVIIFDLDDTLYKELSFVYGGFRAAADFLSPWMGAAPGKIFKELKRLEKIDRKKVFDRFLGNEPYLIKKAVAIYRNHTPRLELFPEAKRCLERYRRLPLYVVTDGNKVVQKKKFEALGLKKWIKKCLCTHAYGLHRKKPSPYCFEKICRLERVSPDEVVYVADNPKKDFIGIKALGFQTVRVLTGPYRHLKVSKALDADRKLKSLDEL